MFCPAGVHCNGAEFHQKKSLLHAADDAAKVKCSIKETQFRPYNYGSAIMNNSEEHYGAVNSAFRRGKRASS